MLRTRLKNIFGQNPSPLWLRVLLFGLAYYICAEVGRFLSPSGGTYVSFWLPAGLYVAVLLRQERRDWLWLALAGLPANFIFDFRGGTPWPLILFFYGANTFQAVLGAWLVQRFVAPRPTLRTVKEFFGLLFFAGILATLPGAVIGAGGLHFAGLSDSIFRSGKVWWGSCAMAVLLFSPLVLVWCRGNDDSGLRRGPPPQVKLPKIIEGVVLFAGMIGATWVIFLMSEGVTTPYKFRTLPFLVWAGLRFGRRGATTANFLYAVLVVYSAGHSAGAPVPGALITGEIVFTVQTFLVVAALVGLVPAITLAERDAVLTKLRESEEHYRNLAEAAFEGVCVSENGRIVDVSDQLMTMLGYRRREVLGRELIEFVTPESRAAVMAAVQEHREAPYGALLVRKDGSSFNCEARARVVHIGGRTLRMTALRDITERLKAEEALRASEARLRAVSDNLPNGIVYQVVREPDGPMRFLHLSAGVARIHGVTVEEGLRDPQLLYDQILPEDRERLRAAEEKSFAAMSVFDEIARIRRGDGEIRWVRLCSAPRHKPDGRVIWDGIEIDITESKRAEAALRDSEEKFSKAFLSSPSSILITRQSDGLIMEVNEAFCRRWDVTPDEARGRTVFDLGMWHHVQEREAVIQQIRREGAIRNLENETILPSGRRTVSLLSVEQIILRGEECLLAVTHDITDLKQAERALQENEAKFRTLFNTANDAIFIMDGPLLLDCNRMTEIMFGCSRSEILGRSPVDFSPEIQFDGIPSADKAGQKIQAALSGLPQFFEWVHRRLDGSLFNAEVSLNRVELRGEVFLQAIVRDITARKQVEEDLRENQRVLTTLMANLPGLVYRCRNDADWTMEFVSEGCWALTGYRPKDLLANRAISFGQLLHPEDRGVVMQTVQVALERRAVFELTYRITAAGGQEKRVWERGQGVYSPEGNLIALEGFITDVTAQHKAEAEREAATQREQEARDEFTRQLIASQEAERTRIAREIHDHLGQLLTALKLDLRSLERRASVLSDIDMRTAFTSKINSAKELADETITSVQKIASELRPGILDRLGLAAAIEVEAQAFEARTGVSCRCTVPQEAGEIPQDRATAAFRIFHEIITNVARHAHATEVNIQLGVNAEALELTVADNGVGVPANRFKNPKSLGLLGMRERAEILGGQIEFRKPDGGSGTVVAVRLPLRGPS
jgi:PAS domain S-box-containing protein